MKCGVVGLGKLGSVLAALLANAGHEVVGVDTSELAIGSLVRPGHVEPGLDDLLDALPHGALTATTSYSALNGCEIVFIVTPTPSLPDGSFDASSVVLAASEATRHTRGTIVVSSTLSPGTCDRDLRMLAITPRLVYAPFFIALGSIIHDMQNPDISLVGSADPGGGKAEEMACRVLADIQVGAASFAYMTFLEAEISKLALNCYLSLKIAFANLITEACDIVGADAYKVLDAVGRDSRVGTKFLKPGGPPAGPCLPRDLRAMERWLPRDLGIDPLLFESVRATNYATVERVVNWCLLHNSVAVLGLAYKPGTPVVDESLGLQVAERLRCAGVMVGVYDPVAVTDGRGYASYLNAQAAIRHSDAVLVATAWPEFAEINVEGKPTLDVWGIVKPQPGVKVLGQP